MPRRKLCFVTGTRAEFGIVRWLMAEVRDDSDLELQVAVTGMHLSPHFGSTFREIEDAGFRIDERVDMLLSEDSPVGITKSVGLGVIGFADAFRRLAPDIVVLVGDRFEMLAAAQAAMIARLPIAHLHGGESTEGSIDEPIRHSITKMSQLHFVSTERYRQRVVQLGEAPDRVWNVGAPGLDALARLRLMERPELERELGLELRPPTFVVTYHPVTLRPGGPESAVGALLTALSAFPEATVVFTGANADTGGRSIQAMVQEYVDRRRDRVGFFTSLGQPRYLSLLAQAAVVIGNSSSGLIEAPAVGTPTVDLGERQRGRVRGESVLNAEEDAGAIEAAIRRALSPAMQETAADRRSPYGQGGASERIRKVLREVELDGIVVKRFHDLDGS